MKIGEVARRSGVADSTIRYYERIGLLESMPRTAYHREYDESVVRQLALIKALQRAGLSLDEIRALLHNVDDHAAAVEGWQQIAQVKLNEIDSAIRQLEMQKQVIGRGLACACVDWNDCALLDAVS